MDNYVLVYQYGAAVSPIKNAKITTFRTTGMSACVGIFAKTQKRSMLLHTTLDVQLDKIMDCIKTALKLSEPNNSKKIKFVIGSCLDKLASDSATLDPHYQQALYASFLDKFMSKAQELSTKIILKEYKQIPIHGAFEIDLQGNSYAGKSAYQLALTDQQALAGAIYDPVKRSLLLLQKYMANINQGYSALDLEIFYNHAYLNLDDTPQPKQEQTNHPIDNERLFIKAVKNNDIKEFNKYIDSVKNLNCKIIDNSPEFNPRLALLFFKYSPPVEKVRYPVHYAAYFDNLEMMQQLINKKVDLNVLGSPFNNYPHKALPVDRLTPLALAAFFGHNRIIKLLLAHHADPDKTDPDRDSALHIAAYADNAEAIKLLAPYSAHLNEPNKEGDTPLHVAVRANSITAVKALLDLGADVNSLTAAGNSAYTLACQERFEQIAQLLYKHSLNNSKFSPVNRF